MTILPGTIDRMVGINGRQLFTRTWSVDHPASNPILILHDSLGSVELWREFPAALASATRRTVIAYDRLGYGRSDPHPGVLQDDHIEMEPQNVAQLLDALGVTRCVAFGHSIGAEMGVACGSRIPQRISAVIAECAQTWIEDRTLATISSARRQFEDPEHFARLAKYHGDKAEWVLDAWTEVWHRPTMRAWTIRPELPKLRCPLLVLHGAQDPFVSLEQPRMMAREAGGPSRLELIDGAGHIPHRETMEEVLKVTTEFLSDLP